MGSHLDFSNNFVLLSSGLATKGRIKRNDDNVLFLFTNMSNS